jgi:glycolate oxidase FAD binding subunit
VVLFGVNPAALGPTLDRLHQSAARPVAVEVHNRASAEARALPVSEPWVLAVGFEEKAATVRWQVETLLTELKAAPVRGTVAVAGDEARPVWDGLCRRPTGDGLLLTGAARPSRLADALLSPALDGSRVAAHGLSGPFSVESSATAAAAASEQLLKLRSAVGDGYMTVRRRPAGWEGWVPPPAPPRCDHSLMLAVKRALDPTDVFNPGRLPFPA